MPHRKSAIVIALLTTCSTACDGGSDATLYGQPSVLLYGPISDIEESYVDWIWGDAGNWLCQQWSSRTQKSGWFYGSSYPWSSVDVFVLSSPGDPLSVVAAENFAYTSGFEFAFEGDPVFFRGRNGFFGAWTIDNIDDDTRETLSGTWYFKPSGGGNFTGELVEGATPLQQGNCELM